MPDNSSDKKKFPSWGIPGAFAIARNQAGSDWAAGVLLYRIKFRWGMKNKLERFGKEWVALSREHWRKEAGLTLAEMKNRALPRLRKLEFIEIRQMKLKPNGPKLLWVSLDLGLLYDATLPFDMDPVQIGHFGIGWEEPSPYPYKKGEEIKLKPNLKLKQKPPLKPSGEGSLTLDQLAKKTELKKSSNSG